MLIKMNSEFYADSKSVGRRAKELLRKKFFGTKL
jgi:hypothetical protein